MLSPGELHKFESINQIKGISIDFTDDYFQNLNSQWAHYIKYDILRVVPVLQIHNIETETKIKDLISRLSAIYQKRNSSLRSIASLYSTLTLLLCTIAESEEYNNTKQNTSNMDTPRHELYLSFMELLETNYQKHHSVRFYAAELCVGLNTLNKCCKDNVGMTPLNLINNRVFQEAKRLLLFTETRSSEISTLLGFPEQAHFINFFKRYTKMSPTKYRETNKE